ncbi:ATP-grasp domain-containing protein [Streptomyces ochraceiscleroticus]|uniref:ATP-grasp domain-containing protein n=1 Tax=Streptomyces ochraceiscleroticus TaxID=47761 RepID=UPI00068C0D86|nr:ATP-grasp domain-containing protein [Streptomyces ochraceiscleroticus]
MIALVNPVSSGAQLTEALLEEGAEFLHVYTEDRAPAAPSGGLPVKTVVHAGLDATAGRLRAMGVSTVLAGSEFGVTLADELAEALGVPHHRHELRAARRDKYWMARALADAGVPHAGTEAVRSEEELRTVLDRWGTFPVVVKPFNSAGSDGCHICPDAGRALDAFRANSGRRNLMGEVNDGVLVQQFLEGPQYIVNTVSMAGRHLLAEIYAERIDREQGAPVLRHIVSRRTLDEAETELVAYVMRCLDALGVREGAAHTEVILTADGPRLVEVNSRLMGPYLSADAYHVAYGYSSPHLLAERLLRPEEFTNRFDLPYGPGRSLAKVYLRAHRAGTVRALDGLRRIRRLPGFHSVARIPAVGEPVRDGQLTTGGCGVAFFVHEDAELLQHSLDVLHEIEDAGELYRIEDESDASPAAESGS